MHCKACDRVIDSKDEELCGECLRAAKAVFHDDWEDDVDERYWEWCEEVCNEYEGDDEYIQP